MTPSRGSAARDLLSRLRAVGNRETKVWWENYVKDCAPFLGVKMPAIRTVLHQWHGERVAAVLGPEDQLDLALDLFEGAHSEEKLAGTLFLREILIPEGVLRPRRDVARFARLFDSGMIHDWNVCDWFCVKVLGPLIEGEGRRWAEPIARWRTAENLWRARASLVSFVGVAGDAAWHPGIARSCERLVRRPERFAKTAVGWILRDVAKSHPAFARGVIDRNLAHFSTESLGNATKGFERTERQRYLGLLRESRVEGRRS